MDLVVVVVVVVVVEEYLYGTIKTKVTMCLRLKIYV